MSAFVSIGELVAARNSAIPDIGWYPELGSSQGALMYAYAQTTQIKQALQSGDPITAISLAAGNPWVTKPSASQVEAMINNPQQGAVILQKLWDAIQCSSPQTGNCGGYRSPLPGTLPFAQLQQNLQQYLAQLQPPATVTPVKAVTQGTINVVNTPLLQSFAQSLMPAGQAPPPPVTTAGPPPTANPAVLMNAQVAALQAAKSAGQINIYGASSSQPCPAYMITQTLADGTQVCIDFIQARANAIIAAAQAALGPQNVAVVAAGTPCAASTSPTTLPDGRILCVNPAVGSVALIASTAACPSGYQSSQVSITPPNLLAGVSVTPMPAQNATTTPPTSLVTDVLCYAMATQAAPAPSFAAPPSYQYGAAPPPAPSYSMPAPSYSQPSYDAGGSGAPMDQQAAPAPAPPPPPLPPPPPAGPSPAVYVAVGLVAVAGVGFLIWKMTAKPDAAATPTDAKT